MITFYHFKLDGIYRCSVTKIELPNQNYKTYVWLLKNKTQLDITWYFYFTS